MDAVERGRAAYDAKLRSVHRYKPELSEHAVSQQRVHVQPVDGIRWVPASSVRANSYNPNFVAPPELKLLKVSLLEDGWTQPLVVRPIDEGERHDASEWELVDGFHRWLLAGDPDVSAMTDGLVPIAPVHDSPEENRMMSTIRHNRARGSHHVLKMADIIVTLSESGYSDEQIIQMLGMDEEEVDRMKDRGDMLKRGSADEFGKGWVPA